MALVVSGLLNKRVGGELGISEITVKSTSCASHSENEGKFPGRLGEDGVQTGTTTADNSFWMMLGNGLTATLLRALCTESRIFARGFDKGSITLLKRSFQL